MDFIIRNAAAISGEPASQSFFSFPTEFVAVHLLQSIVGFGARKKTSGSKEIKHVQPLLCYYYTKNVEKSRSVNLLLHRFGPFMNKRNFGKVLTGQYRTLDSNP